MTSSNKETLLHFTDNQLNSDCTWSDPLGRLDEVVTDGSSETTGCKKVIILLTDGSHTLNSASIPSGWVVLS